MFINLHLHFVFPPSIQLQEVRNAHLHLLYLCVLKFKQQVVNSIYFFIHSSMTQMHISSKGTSNHMVKRMKYIIYIEI